MVLSADACANGPVAAADLGDRYRQAIEYLPWTIKKYVHGMTIDPHWSKDGSSLWYEEDSLTGRRHYRVDPGSGVKQALADQPIEPSRSSYPADIVASPGGQWGIRVIDGNLYRIELASGEQRQLTFDAQPDYAYGLVPHSDMRSLSKRLMGDPPIAYGLWSPAGDKFLTYRVDERKLYKLPFVVPTVPGAKVQVPYVHFQNTAYNFSDSMPEAELMIFDMSTGRRTDLQIPRPLVTYEPTPEGGLKWSADGTKVYAAPEGRDYKSVTVYEADAVTGKARAILSERANATTLQPDVGLTRYFMPVGNGAEMIFYSERSDWGHFYLYDTGSGKLKNAITQGEWAVHRLVRVDSRNRWLYFTAGGREEGRDPYYSHLYRVRLDGSDLTLLTPENAQHEIQFSPDGNYFVDTYSTVTDPPVHVLRSNDGRLVMELARADVSKLVALGWIAPIRFKVKAVDGKTDLYGVLFLPADFDERNSYPIINAIYGGTHELMTPRGFLQDRLRAMAMAQLGFVVMHFDARATPLRSQSMQDIGFGANVQSPVILEDHVAAMEQLAERYPFIDLSRAGVCGHSGGGARTVRAMLQFPDFFKVGVATAGSHNIRLITYADNRNVGRPQDHPESYERTGMELAGNLKGKLLLGHGFVDDDVHVAITMQMAAALIRENKDFDLFIQPALNHKNLWLDGYTVRKVWDYFVEHLMGAVPPKGVKIPDYDGPAYRRQMQPDE